MNIQLQFIISNLLIPKNLPSNLMINIINIYKISLSLIVIVMTGLCIKHL